MSEVLDFKALMRLVKTLDLENSSIEDSHGDDVTLILGGADGTGWHIGGVDADRKDAEILLKLLKAIPELVRSADRFRYFYGHIEYLMQPDFTPDSIVRPIVTLEDSESDEPEG